MFIYLFKHIPPNQVALELTLTFKTVVITGLAANPLMYLQAELRWRRNEIAGARLAAEEAVALRPDSVKCVV
jgi:hypothetical protein